MYITAFTIIICYNMSNENKLYLDSCWKNTYTYRITQKKQLLQQWAIYTFSVKRLKTLKRKMVHAPNITHICDENTKIMFENKFGFPHEWKTIAICTLQIKITVS